MVWDMSDRVLLPGFVLLWASGYVVGAFGIEVASPLALMLVRFTLASCALVPLAWRHRHGAPSGRKYSGYSRIGAGDQW